MSGDLYQATYDAVRSRSPAEAMQAFDLEWVVAAEHPEGMASVGPRSTAARVLVKRGLCTWFCRTAVQITDLGTAVADALAS